MKNKIDLPIYLASKSPRRRKLLKQINIPYRIIDVQTDEKFSDKETPLQNAKRIANEKSIAAISKNVKGIVITADTIVVLDNKKIAKPTSKKNAVQMLKMLSGLTHIVYTGYCIANTITGKRILGAEKTYVTFRELSDKEIKTYVDSGSPMDKAGAYGIQDDYGAVFVSRIKGCYYNVVGLPLSKIFQGIEKVK
ncbi:MAG: septum formation protein Maf [Ignavibacteriales bacterium]|nr:MAG: septum formation protein Maf [Ignavibacteriales bacterium]